MVYLCNTPLYYLHERVYFNSPMAPSPPHTSYLDLVDTVLPDCKVQFLTIDTEDYTTTVDTGLPEVELRHLPSNLESNLDRLLDVFAEKEYQCTFFILGRIADRIIPQIKRMVAEGHEVASHGMSHRRVLEITPAEFREELRSSKHLIEDLSGKEVVGFRAPMFSITNENLWALDILAEEGYRYDSSITPFANFAYGIKGAPKIPHRLTNGLIEVPMSVFDRLGYPFMVAGGFYLRVYPLWLHKLFLRFRQEETTTFYLHPWELDDGSYNLWDQLPNKGKHWSSRPKLMRMIAAYNRPKTLEKYLSLIEYASKSTLPRALNQVISYSSPPTSSGGP